MYDGWSIAGFPGADLTEGRHGGIPCVVFMVHTGEDPEPLITRKVISINQTLADEQDDLPQITLSAGVSYRLAGEDPEKMFRQADIALYYVKDHGREGCCFYSDALKDKTKPKPDDFSSSASA